MTQEPSNAAILALPALGDLIHAAGLRTKKKFGQNFLLDPNITDKIARTAGDLQGRTVLEIGPGPGGLTRSLLLAGAEKVIAIETDPACVELLASLEAAAAGRLHVLHQDALTVDYGDLITPDTKIVANLPYNVGTLLLLKWLPFRSKLANMTLMFQKEVALRLCAAPRTKDYGRLSVLTQWYTAPRMAFDLPPQAFTPPPKVTSSVVVLTPRNDSPPLKCFGTFEKLLKHAFGQRRKMLRASLKTLTKTPEPLLKDAGILPTDRPEELSLSDFCHLANTLASAEGGHLSGTDDSAVSTESLSKT